MLRVSYTLLTLWQARDTQGLMNYINGVRSKPTQQMSAGLMFDNEACEMALTELCLPDHFGGFKLTKPEPQLKMEVEFTNPKPGVDSFTLVGVIDVYDAGIIYELKTGGKSSIDYAKTMQVPLYALLCEKTNRPVVKGRICRFNQYEQSSDIHMMLTSDTMIRQTEEKLLAQVAEIQHFLSTGEVVQNVTWIK